MDHPTFERRSLGVEHHGPDGQGIAVGIWLSLPLWLGLGLIAILFRPRQIEEHQP